MIKAVLFDMDGILFDSEKYYMDGTLEWMRRLGYKGSRQELYPIIGLTMDNVYRYLGECLNNTVSYDKIKEINEYYFIHEHIIDCKSLMFDDVKEVLQSLKKMGIICAVCSSSDLPLIRKSLEQMEIADYFDLCLSSDQLPKGKPDPGIYLLAMKTLGVKASECVIYEDSLPGIKAAKGSGAYTIAKRDKEYGIDQSMADIIVDNAYEMLEIVRGFYGRSH